MFLDTTDIYI